MLLSLPRDHTADYEPVCSDFLMRLSNERFVSTVHRVNNTSGKERYAIPFFWTMNLDAAVEPLKSCTSEDNPPRFEPLTVGEVSFRVFSCLALELWLTLVLAVL